MRPVKVGQIDGGEALIDGGLQEGEQVVVDGQYKLQPGAPVQITTPTQPGNVNRLTQADETHAPNQEATGKQSPGQTGAERHGRHPQGSPQPEGSAPPAMAD